MHGLIFSSIQSFVTNTYGAEKWSAATRKANLGTIEFEAMLSYDARLAAVLIDAVANVLARSCEEVMEDIGTYLVSHPSMEGLRRLLRFGGVNFVEFLHSLDDLPGRARLAVPELDLPPIELHEVGPGQFKLICSTEIAYFGHVMMGLLGAMADDYGALALLSHDGTAAQDEMISIILIETAFSEGRDFHLGARA